MASPTPSRVPQPPPENVDPRWLLQALALTLFAAATCAYLSICFLIYQGGWQRFLTPSPIVDKTPTLPFELIHFDSAATGQPRLTAWWIPLYPENPSQPNPSLPIPTILFLHDGAGSLSATLPTLTLLHQARVNIFAIDYRGFGQSDATHPNEARMTDDASAALEYLLTTRHLSASHIIPYGQGLGAVFAAKLASSQPRIPAFILDNPDPNIFDRVATEGQTTFLPMHLLLRDRFDLASARSTRPKLLLANSPHTPQDPTRTATNQAFFRTLPDPRLTVTFPPQADPAYLESLTRFLDEYIHPGARR